jgi:hypothetical protein
MVENNTSGEAKFSRLEARFLEEVKQSCASKLSDNEYHYIIGRIEGSVEVVIRSMAKAYDRGYGFLKLAIHPGSTQESMSSVYEKIINQTPWKYKRTVLSFVEAIDTIFKFSSKNEAILEKIAVDNKISGDKDALLSIISEITINYIVKLIEQEKTYLAS